MTYTIALVDEGLLDLTRFKTPNAWDTFYARQSLGVKTWDIFDDVIGAYGGKINQNDNQSIIWEQRVMALKEFKRKHGDIPLPDGPMRNWSAQIRYDIRRMDDTTVYGLGYFYATSVRYDSITLFHPY